MTAPGPPDPNQPPPPPGPYPPPEQPGQPYQPSYGQQPPPGQPWDQQQPYGQPPPGQPFGQPQYGQPPARRQVPRWLVALGAVLAVLVVAVVLIAVLGPSDAEVGDCLKDSGTDQLETVDCDDASAQYRVVGIETGTKTFPDYEADPNTCSAFPGSERSFWVGGNGDETGQGTVYCVAAP